MMAILIKIFVAILWIGYACNEGKREGHYYHDRMTATDPDKENIHWIYLMQRLCYLISTYLISLYYEGFTLANGIFYISLGMIFSFFHNGAYYITRNKLNNKIYTKGWWSSSTTSEATMEFGVAGRIFLAFTGLVGIIASLDMTLKPII